MLQAASIYTLGNGEMWSVHEMIGVMQEVSRTSLQLLGCDLFEQLTHNTTCQG